MNASMFSGLRDIGKIVKVVALDGRVITIEYQQAEEDASRRKLARHMAMDGTTTTLSQTGETLGLSV